MLAEDEKKVRDLLRAGDLAQRAVVASGTSDRLLTRTARRPSGCSERLFSGLGVSDPLAKKGVRSSESLYAAQRFRAIDKAAKMSRPTMSARPKAVPTPQPKRYADAAPAPLSTVSAAGSFDGQTSSEPVRPSLPTKSTAKSVGKTGRPRTIRSAKKQWEAAPMTVLSADDTRAETPSPAPPRAEAPGLEGLFSTGATRPRLGSRPNKEPE